MTALPVTTSHSTFSQTENGLTGLYPKAFVMFCSVTLASLPSFPLAPVEPLEPFFTENVEIVPSKINATINITSPQKEVPIKVIPKHYDKIVFGKSISNITTDISKVTIYGDKAKLDNISYIPVYVDVADIKENKKYSITITKPSGVREISEKIINVNVLLGSEVSKEINDIYLEYQNLGDGLTVQAVDANSTKVTVSIKGVESVVSAVDPTTIKAYVDLKGLGVGTHEIPVLVSGSDEKVKYSSKTTKITLRITQKQ